MLLASFPGRVGTRQIMWSSWSIIGHCVGSHTPSVVPSPFPPPLFDHLPYASTRGKAWKIWSRAMTSGRKKVDTRRAVPNS